MIAIAAAFLAGFVSALILLVLLAFSPTAARWLFSAGKPTPNPRRSEDGFDAG